MYDHVHWRPSGAFILLSVILFGGCGGKGNAPDVAAGHYRADVAGALSDSLVGTARYRIDDGSIVGLELGSERGPGLSIELEPRPVDLRQYEVVESELFGLERPGGTPGMLGFLTVDGAQFEATDGTLEVTYVGDDYVGGTFTFQMEGTVNGLPGDVSSVEVVGAVNARPE